MSAFDLASIRNCSFMTAGNFTCNCMNCQWTRRQLYNSGLLPLFQKQWEDNFLEPPSPRKLTPPSEAAG